MIGRELPSASDVEFAVLRTTDHGAFTETAGCSLSPGA